MKCYAIWCQKKRGRSWADPSSKKDTLVYKKFISKHRRIKAKDWKGRRVQHIAGLASHWPLYEISERKCYRPESLWVWHHKLFFLFLFFRLTAVYPTSWILLQPSTTLRKRERARDPTHFKWWLILNEAPNNNFSSFMHPAQGKENSHLYTVLCIERIWYPF